VQQEISAADYCALLHDETRMGSARKFRRTTNATKQTIIGEGSFDALPQHEDVTS
jgi:hypothetical protein